MPEMPGPELAAQVRLGHPNLPVVFMSGYIYPVIDTDLVPKASIVQKPFTEESLTAALRTALRPG